MITIIKKVYTVYIYIRTEFINYLLLFHIKIFILKNRQIFASSNLNNEDMHDLLTSFLTEKKIVN